MKIKYYRDQSVACPFYSREESLVIRKIHCEGYAVGNHIHVCFDSKELIKAHKNKFCKKASGHKKCPLYQIIAKKYQEEKNEIL